MRLLIIGQGTWSKKILTALNLEHPSIRTQSISARECLRGTADLNSLSAEFDVIWICTKPNWQMEILVQLSQFPGKIILEKPYLFDSASFGLILDFIRTSAGVLQLSELWTVKEIWAEAKLEILKERPTKLHIMRGGSTAHPYLNEVEDWLPHDINLLFDLYGIEILESRISDIQWEHNNKEVKFLIRNFDGTEILIHSGKLKGGRRALWESTNLRIDFMESSITRNSQIWKITQPKNPFFLQIQERNHYDRERLTNQLKVQNFFRTSLFG